MSVYGLATERPPDRAAYGIDQSRITVVPLGVTPPESPLVEGVSAEMPAGVRGTFLLHVGDLHERRNLPTVVSALAEARAKHLKRVFKLVLYYYGIVG